MSATVELDVTFRALAPYYYLDPDHFRLEMEKVFHKTWQYACHASEVAERGAYVTFEIGAGEAVLGVITDLDAREVFEPHDKDLSLEIAGDKQQAILREAHQIEIEIEIEINRLD